MPGYIRAGDSRIVYRVSEDIVSALMAVSYDDLRHKEVLTAAFGDINQIDVSLDGCSRREPAAGKSGITKKATSWRSNLFKKP